MLGDKSPASSSRLSRGDTDCEYIEHYVTKLDTLAGVAIKYGVEVADIKRYNGLSTDSQMYAHKMLRIPRCGRHGATVALSTPSSSGRSSIQRDCVPNRDKRSPSPAMELLRGYYGLSSPLLKTVNSTALGGTDGEVDSDIEPFSPIERPPMIDRKSFNLDTNGFHEKGKSNLSLPESGLSNGYASGSAMEHEHVSLSDAVPSSSVTEANYERSVRRRFKGEAMNPPISTEATGKQDFNVPDKVEANVISSTGIEVSIGLPASIFKVIDGALAGSKNKESPLSKVRKSSSTSSLQDQASPQLNQGVQKFVAKVEEKLAGSLILSQAGSRGFSDMPPVPPKPTYRFKEALD